MLCLEHTPLKDLFLVETNLYYGICWILPSEMDLEWKSSYWGSTPTNRFWEAFCGNFISFTPRIFARKLLRENLATTNAQYKLWSVIGLKSIPHSCEAVEIPNVTLQLVTSVAIFSVYIYTHFEYGLYKYLNTRIFWVSINDEQFINQKYW